MWLLVWRQSEKKTSKNVSGHLKFSATNTFVIRDPRSTVPAHPKHVDLEGISSWKVAIQKCSQGSYANLFQKKATEETWLQTCGWMGCCVSLLTGKVPKWEMIWFLHRLHLLFCFVIFLSCLAFFSFELVFFKQLHFCSSKENMNLKDIWPN